MQGRPRPSDSKAPMKLKADTTRAVGLTNHRSAEHAGGDAMTNGWRSVPALEGVVAKWEHGTYQIDGRGTSWLKIKNPDYSQIVGRPELFDAATASGLSSPSHQRAAGTPPRSAQASSIGSRLTYWRGSLQLCPVSIRVHCASPRFGLLLQIDPWPRCQVTHELIAEIQAHLRPSADTPRLATPLSRAPQFAVLSRFGGKRNREVSPGWN
jgi:hypothetical protein